MSSGHHAADLNDRDPGIIVVPDQLNIVTTVDWCSDQTHAKSNYAHHQRDAAVELSVAFGGLNTIATTG